VKFPSGTQGKLALSIAVVLLAALGVTYLAVYRGTGSELQSRTETDLEREIETLTGRLAAGDADDPATYRKRADRIASAETFGPNARVISISINGGGTATNQPGLVGPGLGPQGSDDSKGSGGARHDSESGEDHEDHESHEETEKRKNADLILGAALAIPRWTSMTSAKFGC
jgi:hypothetical protein